MLTDQNWILSVGVFLPLAGVLVMMFVPKGDELTVKSVGLITAIATVVIGIITLAQYDYGQADKLQFAAQAIGAAYQSRPLGGIGAFVNRHLGDGLDIRLNTPVQRIRWNGPDGRVEVDGLTARACIVTVSTGVLYSGAVRFEPDLPAATQEAIAALPMGLAIKVALRANGPDRLGLSAHTSVDRQARPGEHLVP